MRGDKMMTMMMVEVGDGKKNCRIAFSPRRRWSLLSVAVGALAEAFSCFILLLLRTISVVKCICSSALHVRYHKTCCVAGVS